MREPEVLKLDALCREFNVILLVVRSYGLAGVLRVRPFNGPTPPAHVRQLRSLAGSHSGLCAPGSSPS